LVAAPKAEGDPLPPPYPEIGAFEAGRELVDALPSFEGPYVLSRKGKPFPLLTFLGKPLVPVTFNAGWIVGSDIKNRFNLLRKLERNFAFSPQAIEGLPYFVFSA
jgi:hypothetical protein